MFGLDIVEYLCQQEFRAPVCFLDWCRGIGAGVKSKDRRSLACTCAKLEVFEVDLIVEKQPLTGRIPMVFNLANGMFVNAAMIVDS